jgi:hypothetical protein
VIHACRVGGTDLPAGGGAWRYPDPSGRADERCRPLPATHVLYRHDDGRWYEARVLQQIRSGSERRWRVLVTYTTAPGFTHTRGEWADSDVLAPLGAQESYRPSIDDVDVEIEAAAQRSRL